MKLSAKTKNAIPSLFVNTSKYDGITFPYTKDKTVFIDFETYFNSYKPEMLSMCIDGKKYGWDIDVITRQGFYKEFLDNFFTALNEARKVGAHDCKFELMVLRTIGYPYQNLLHKMIDTRALPHVLNTNNKLERTGLKAQVLQVFKHQMVEYEQAVNLSRDEFMNYCMEDSYWSERLFHYYVPKIRQFQLEVAYQLEVQIAFVLVEMKAVGTYFNKNKLLDLKPVVEKQLIDYHKEMCSISKSIINPRSSKDLEHVIYTKFQLPNKWTTEKGNKCFNEEAIQGMIKWCSKNKPEVTSFFTSLLSYTALKKFKDMYLTYAKKTKTSDGKPRFLDMIGDDGYIRTSYDQMFAASSRLTSRDPNLQNLPSGRFGAETIRKCFEAPSGYKLIGCDYSQFELKIMAHYSQDESFLHAFNNNIDVHQMTADKMKLEGKEGRKKAKQANFKIPYGAAAPSFVDTFNVSLKEAKEIINDWYNTFPNVKKFLEENAKFGSVYGYMPCLTGKIRKLDVTTFVENECKNHPMQNTNADIMKLVMIFLWKVFFPTPCKIIMQIHDELIVMVPEKWVDWAKKVIEFTFQNMYKLSVPLTADAVVAENWYDTK